MGLQTLLTADPDPSAEATNQEQKEQAASPQAETTIQTATTQLPSPTSEDPIQQAKDPEVLLTELGITEAKSSGTDSPEDIKLEEPVQIGGVEYQEAITISVSNIDFFGDFVSEAQFDLGRKYTVFSGIVGMPDDALSTGFLQVQFLDENNKVLFEKDTTIGSEEVVEIDVTDVLRLKIRVTNTGEKVIDESTRTISMAKAGVS